MFYLLIVQNETTPAIYAYNTYNDVLAAFHTEMGYRHETRTSTKCAILNSELNMIKSEMYVNEIVPEPNAEPTEGEQ